MIKSSTKLRATIVFFVALISAYSGIYSFTSNEYEKEASKLEKSISTIRNQVQNAQGHFAWDKIPPLQNTLIPEEPKFLSPLSVWTSIFGPENLSGKHIYQAQEILQQHKSELTNIRFQGLVLGKQVKFKKKQIVPNHHNDNYQLNFQESNFSNTHFTNSVIAYLNLKKSNFYNSEYDNVLIVHTKLSHSNLSNTRVNKTFLTQTG